MKQQTLVSVLAPRLLPLLSLILSHTLCACASRPNPNPEPAATPTQAHALDVTLEELSTATHDIEQYQLDACREALFPQGCFDLAQALAANHPNISIDATEQALGRACDGALVDACQLLGRPLPKHAPARACSLEENVKPDGTRYSEEERNAISSRYKRETSADLNAIAFELGYCVTRANRGEDRYSGYLRIDFRVDARGNGRVVGVSPEEVSGPLRPCIEDVFTRHSFAPHKPLACAAFTNMLLIK